MQYTVLQDVQLQENNQLNTDYFSITARTVMFYSLLRYKTCSLNYMASIFALQISYSHISC